MNDPAWASAAIRRPRPVLFALSFICPGMPQKTHRCLPARLVILQSSLFLVVNGGSLSIVVTEGQRPPSIRIGLKPSSIPYAFKRSRGAGKGSGPIFATASGILARAQHGTLPHPDRELSGLQRPFSFLRVRFPVFVFVFYAAASSDGLLP